MTDNNEKKEKEVKKKDQESPKPPPPTETPQGEKAGGGGPGKPEKDEAVNPETNQEKKKGDSFRSTTRDIHGNAVIAGEIRAFFMGEGFSYHKKIFSLSQATPISEEFITAAKEQFVPPNDEIDAIAGNLLSNRLLLLTGEPGSGKYHTAKYLVADMTKVNQKQYQVKVVEPLEKDIYIDLSDVIEKNNDLGGTIIIFKNIFRKMNQHLLEFFKALSKERKGFLSQKLAEVDAFLIFTANTAALSEEQFSNLQITCPITPLAGELLERGFEARFVHFCPTQDKETGQYSEVQERKQEICKKLGNMPMIATFIDEYLDKIGTAPGGKSIDDAITEVMDIQKRVTLWFQEELGKFMEGFEEHKEKFEAWIFAVCLTLFHGTSFADFILIHDDVARWFLDVLYPFDEHEKFSFSLSEKSLLKKCNAKITLNIAPKADKIEFCDSRYKDILQEILIRDYRKVLLKIAAYIKKYVESNYRYQQRRLASHLLAWIGTLEPEALTIDLIREWSQMKKDIHRANVGYLYEGIFKLENDEYKKYCMAYLKHMALSHDIYTQWTAIAAYKQIGVSDLPFAMEELRKILEKISDRKDRSEENLLDILYKHGELVFDAVLMNLEDLHKATGYLLSAIQFSITALFFLTDNSIEVIKEFKKWIKKGNKNTRIIIGFFMLGKGGILDELGSIEVDYRSTTDEENEKLLYSNILLNSLTTGESAIDDMVDFFKELYEKCFPEFKAVDHPKIKRALFWQIGKWAADTLDNTRVNTSVKNLIIKLYNSGNKDLQTNLFHYMKQWEAQGKEKKIKVFTDSIIDQLYDF